jgi:hypothetical protein
MLLFLRLDNHWERPNARLVFVMSRSSLLAYLIRPVVYVNESAANGNLPRASWGITSNFSHFEGLLEVKVQIAKD